MKQLNKYKLDYEISLEYLKKNLRKANELSSQILEVLFSHSGEFYVLLPEDSDLKRIYDLNSGYITSSIDKEICYFVVDKMKNTDYSCIFDDVNTTASDSLEDEFFANHSLFYKNEVYHTIKRRLLSEDTFLKCMLTSDGIWHSLCIITIVDLDEIEDKKLDQDMIKKICVNAQLVMIGAYDGEGYIFWERTK